jgi:hypothetical protein
MLRCVTTSPARRLVIAYAALLISLNLFALLPGNPDFTSGWGFVGSIVIQAVVVWRLWQGSQIVWLLMLLVAVLTPVEIVLSGGPLQVWTFVLIVVPLAQAGILTAPPMRAFVWSSGQAPAPAP